MSASRHGCSLPLGKTRYPLYRRLGGPQGRSGQVRKISPPPDFDPRTVQPVASRYTDYATRPFEDLCCRLNYVVHVAGNYHPLRALKTEDFNHDLLCEVCDNYTFAGINGGLCSYDSVFGFDTA